jgi:hypothetical protein
MVKEPVKGKLIPFRKIHFTNKPKSVAGLLLSGLLTFIFSVTSLLPSAFVERWFSRATFPKVSTFFGYIADAVPFAWLDVLIVTAILYVFISARRRQWFSVAGTIVAGYLIFFWSWGINYHREPLQSKLVVNAESTTKPGIDAFTHRAATEINSLSAEIARVPYDENQIRAAAGERVARVVEKLDGTRWRAATRIKVSVLANPWFRFAGIDGFFNPLVHEPIVNSKVLDIERPFIIAHELAHARGYPDEGDANFVALLATLMSDNPRLRYGGWLELWLYLRTPQSDSLLDSGPRQDIRRIFERLRSERIAWVSNLQATMLDWFLKANTVPEGVRSYSRIVVLAAGTQNSWEQFR